MPGDTPRGCSKQGHAHWQPLPEASVSRELSMFPPRTNKGDALFAKASTGLVDTQFANLGG